MDVYGFIFEIRNSVSTVLILSGFFQKRISHEYEACRELC